MRNAFWKGNFIDHLNSTRHKTNCVKKATHKEKNWRRTLNCEGPQKRMRQTVLNFATVNPTAKQTQDRILGCVCSTIASGSSASTIDLTICKNIVTGSKTQEYCNGILPHKDLSNRFVQGGMRAILEYYTNQEQEEIGYRMGPIGNKDKTFSIFSQECTSICATVK